MKPTVLIGIPTCEWYEYCLLEFVASIRKLDYDNFNVLFVDNSETEKYSEKIRSLGFDAKKVPHFERARERMVQSRNLIRREALDKNYDYLLLLDQDVIAPADALNKLLSHEKQAITGIYYSICDTDGKPTLIPLLWKEQDEEKQLMKQFTAEDLEQARLIEARACGSGCLLIHRSVLEQVEFRYKPEMEAFDDIWFCNDIKQRGIQLYADTSVKCQHKIVHRLTNKEWIDRRKTYLR